MLPAYTYIPATNTPHPIRHPEGHSHGRKGRTPAALDADAWHENRNFLLAIDLFNCGYYWEAHEEWERLWRASNPESIVGRFLKGPWGAKNSMDVSLGAAWGRKKRHGGRAGARQGYPLWPNGTPRSIYI